MKTHGLGLQLDRGNEGALPGKKLPQPRRQARSYGRHPAPALTTLTTTFSEKEAKTKTKNVKNRSKI